MKIIIGSISFYSPNISGVGISAHLLARFLKSKGHDVYVMTSSDKAKNYIEQDISKTVTVLRLKAIKNPFRKGFYVPFSPKKRVNEIVAEIKPDIVHIQDPMPMNVALQKEVHKRNVPVVLTNHFMIDYVLAYVPRPFRPIVRVNFLKKLVSFYNKCDYITCPTQTIVDILKAEGVTKPTVALSNGVDIDRFNNPKSAELARKKFSIPNKPVILCLGRIDKDKSLDVLMNAIPKILKKTDVHFIIAGWGDLFDKITTQIKQENLAKSVTLTGAVPYESDLLVGLHNLADIFVIPSTIETQSIVTMEAMAAGKPIIAAKAGALPELVKPSQNGYLFEPGNVQQLADNIIQLIQDKKTQIKMGQKSFEIVKEHSLEANLEKFEELYKKCLKK